MLNNFDTFNHALVGRQAARLALRLPTEMDKILAAMSTPNGRIFTIWASFYMALWGVGLIAIIYFRGHPLLQFALSILLGSQLHTITILQHDCGHRSAYQSTAANLWVGRVLAWFIFMPFTTFTELHRRHHGFLGQKDKDPDEWFYEGGRVQLFLRECLFMPRFIYLSVTQILTTDVRRKILSELVFNFVTYAFLVIGLWMGGAIDILFFGFLLPMLLLGLVFNPISRGFEHYPLACLPSGDARREDLRFNTITVTSRLIGFLWANINYHVEHHMHPRVPFYRLRALHKLFSCKEYLIAPYPLWQLDSYSRDDHDMSAAHLSALCHLPRNK